MIAGCPAGRLRHADHPAVGQPDVRRRRPTRPAPACGPRRPGCPAPRLGDLLLQLLLLQVERRLLLLQPLQPERVLVDLGVDQQDAEHPADHQRQDQRRRTAPAAPPPAAAGRPSRAAGGRWPGRHGSWLVDTGAGSGRAAARAALGRELARPPGDESRPGAPDPIGAVAGCRAWSAPPRSGPPTAVCAAQRRAAPGWSRRSRLLTFMFPPPLLSVPVPSPGPRRGHCRPPWMPVRPPSPVGGASPCTRGGTVRGRPAPSFRTGVAVRVDPFRRPQPHRSGARVRGDLRLPRQLGAPAEQPQRRTGPGQLDREVDRARAAGPAGERLLGDAGPPASGRTAPPCGRPRRARPERPAAPSPALPAPCLPRSVTPETFSLPGVRPFVGLAPESSPGPARPAGPTR